MEKLKAIIEDEIKRLNSKMIIDLYTWEYNYYTAIERLEWVLDQIEKIEGEEKWNK